jgi:hypothetical protein
MLNKAHITTLIIFLPEIADHLKRYWMVKNHVSYWNHIQMINKILVLLNFFAGYYLIQNLFEFKNLHDDLITLVPYVIIDCAHYILEVIYGVFYNAFVVFCILTISCVLLKPIYSLIKIFILKKLLVLTQTDSVESLFNSMPDLIDAMKIIAERRNLTIRFGYLTLLSLPRNQKKTISVENLNSIAPLSCAGLRNTKKVQQMEGDQGMNSSKYPEYTIPFECSICLEKYNPEQLSRTLPCAHSFHPHCIDAWIIECCAFCPICKRELNIPND